MPGRRISLITVTLLVTVVASATNTFAQKPTPLTLDDVVILIESGIESQDIEQQILERGIVPVFLNAERLSRLRDAGANDTLMGTVAYHIGKSYQRSSGRYQESLIHFNLASKLAPASVLPWLGKREVFDATGQYQDALEACNQAAKINPRDHRVYFHRCLSYMSLRQYAKAIDDVVVVTKLAPNWPDGYRLKALLLAASPVDELRDGTQAVKDALRAIALAKKTPVTSPFLLLMSLAAAFAEVGDFEKAVAAQTDALKLAPEAGKPLATSLLRNYKQGIKFRLATASSAKVRPPDGKTPRIDEPGRQNPGQSTPQPVPKVKPAQNLVKLIQDTMVKIPGGKFKMGSERYPDADDESPVHEVEVKAFYLSKFEVTNRIYALVMQGSADDISNPDNPVESVSWNDCQEFLRKLNAALGAPVFRLPTESEWEYAARAGTTTEYSFGDDKAKLSNHGWYKENSDSRTHPCGEKKSNALGLCDMYGNVGEWCQDEYQRYGKPNSSSNGALRVFRGGSWANSAMYCRSAARSVGRPDGRLKGVGFRLAADVPIGSLQNPPGGVAKPSKVTLDDAIAQLERAYQKNKSDVVTARKLGQHLTMRGYQHYQEKRHPEAVKDLERSLAIVRSHAGPSVISCYALLTWIRATSPNDSVRNGQAAIKTGSTVCGITRWEQWVPLSCLAAAYAETGEFEMAIKRQNDAIPIAPPEMVDELKRRLELYRTNKPLRIEKIW